MADIRIKDLTTEVSSTATGDFFVIDGTTGTRKTPAFNPTFGGNATVTGTLSSGGNLSVTGTSAQVILGQASGSQLTYLIRPAQAGGAIQMVQDSATANRWLSLGISDNVGVYSELMRVAGATGNILIPGTVASTTTSSGALVVGNGTSGGLGVGGNITLGGGVNIAGAASDPLPAGTSGIWTLSGSGLRINSAGLTFASLTGSTLATARVAINGTTASTTTSNGALVVSGGVGVDGAINAAGTLTSTASTDSGLLQLNLVNSSTGTSASSLFRFNAGTRTATLQAYNDTHATLAGQLRVGTSNGDIVVVPSGVATATFSGSGLASFGGSVTSRIDVNGSTSAGLGLRQTGVRDWFLSAESSELRVSCLTAGSIFAFTSGTPVAIRDSSISTSTSSGALVVSGGVGVAKQLYVGGNVNLAGDLTVEKTEPIVSLKRAADTNLNLINLWTGVNADFGIGLRNTSDSDLHIYNYGTSNDALKISKATSAVTLNSTTASTSTSSGALVVGGGVGVGGKVTSTALGLANTSQSIPAWGDVGAQLSVAGAVITDTTSSGTVSRFVSNSIAASSIAASSPTTYTQAATLFIAAGPTANTNVTITNSYALFIAGGRINFGGLPTSSAGLQAGTLWNDGGTLKVA